ncbi:hypothetical protein DMUE_0555 [Dictyocoela muelleri]|nr:hypothetical protein DMUE_0555 [Dictyocoela muelleri]
MNKKLNPGLIHLKPKLTITNEFDSTLEKQTLPNINTDMLEILDISLTDLVINLLINENEEINNEREYVPWLRKPGYISADYYQKQEKRSELIKEQTKVEDDTVDYELYLKNSFIHIDSEPVNYHFNVDEFKNKKIDQNINDENDEDNNINNNDKDNDINNNDEYQNINNNDKDNNINNNIQVESNKLIFTDSWELFPKEENYTAVHFTDEKPSLDFIFEKEENNIVFAKKDGSENVYSSIMNDISEYLVIELADDGKAYYSRIKENLRLKMTKLKNKDDQN